MHLRGVTIHPERFPVRDVYPFNLDVFGKSSAVEFRVPVTFFAGENGAGKSTLLRAVARACGIHIWGEIERTRYEHNPHEESLRHALDVEWAGDSAPGSFFNSQTFRSYTSLLDEWAAADPGQLDRFGGKSLMTLSHGQSLMSYFRTRYRIRGINFLDEPETALSPRSQMELLDILAEMGESGHAQFIIASHSPLLLSCPGAEILSFDRVPIAPVAYEETEHYRVYREFFQGR